MGALRNYLHLNYTQKKLKTEGKTEIKEKCRDYVTRQVIKVIQFKKKRLLEDNLIALEV